jgi:hypothetical protein
LTQIGFRLQSADNGNSLKRRGALLGVAKI